MTTASSEGQLRPNGDRWQLTFTRRLPHRPEKVWRALTEAEHLQAWFPTTIEGDRETGAKLRFSFPFEEAPPLDGEMLAYDPPRLMELRWDEDVLRFELAPEDGGETTVLTLVNTFDEKGRAARDAAGWHACLDNLHYHLSGEQPPFDPEKRWADVHPGYVERLGPEASTVGPPDWHPEG